MEPRNTPSNVGEGMLSAYQETYLLFQEGPQLPYKRRGQGVRWSDAGTSAGDTVPQHSPTQDIPVPGGGTKSIPKSWIRPHVLKP